MTVEAPVRSIAAAPTRVARPTVRRRRPWLWFSLVVIIAFFGLIGGRISLDRSAFTVDQIQDEIATEQTRNLELQLRIAELHSPHRIATRAKAMGMVYPSSQTPLTIEPVETGAGPADRWTALQSLLDAGS